MEQLYISDDNATNEKQICAGAQYGDLQGIPGTALVVFNLRAKCEQVICFTPRSPYSREEHPVPLNKRIVGVRIRLRHIGEDIKFVTQAEKDL